MISSNKLALTLVLAAVLAVGVSAIATTTTYAQSRTINADKVTIQKGSDITINVNGGAGAKGEKGDKGDTGSPGSPGAPGAPGRNGTNGTGVSPSELATLQTILALYQNGSLSSVTINAENLTTPPAPVTNNTGDNGTIPNPEPVTCQPGFHEENGACAQDAAPTNTTTTTNTTSTTENGTTVSNSTSETVPTSFIGSIAKSLGF